MAYLDLTTGEQAEYAHDTRRLCRGGCGRKAVEDGWCHHCSSEPLESDDVILARKRRLKPEWFDLDGAYDPLGTGRR